MPSFRVSASALAAAAALLASAVCHAQYTAQSAPFRLTLRSPANATLNGSTLYACHTGAAIESLCQPGGFTTNPTSATTYNFNTSAATPASASDDDDDAGGGVTGLLTYVLRGGNFNLSEPMRMYFPLSTNVALPLFEPSATGTTVAFDADDRLNIQDYVDDNGISPTAGATRAYYRWYICQTYYSGYTYQTLNWVLGSCAPQNPTCQKVEVVREFV